MAPSRMFSYCLHNRLARPVAILRCSYSKLARLRAQLTFPSLHFQSSFPVCCPGESPPCNETFETTLGMHEHANSSEATAHLAARKWPDASPNQPLMTHWQRITCSRYMPTHRKDSCSQLRSLEHVRGNYAGIHLPNGTQGHLSNRQCSPTRSQLLLPRQVLLTGQRQICHMGPNALQKIVK